MQSKAALRIWGRARLLGEVIKPLEDHAVVFLGFVGGRAFDEIGNDSGLQPGELEELLESKSGLRFRAGGHGEAVMCGVGQA